MYLVDYHLHSDNSFDGKNTIRDMCVSAINKGLKEVCFTEHFSVDPEVPTYGFLDYHKYNSEIEKARDEFATRLVVKKGLEICEPFNNKQEIKQNIDILFLDYVLGSVHNIRREKLRQYIKGKSNKEAYSGFFNETYKNAAYGNIDVIAHLDLMKRYAFNDLGNYSFKEMEDIIFQILIKLVDRNIGLEVNTSGLRTEVKEIIPSIDILKLYKNLGGEIITIGSDAHSDDMVYHDIAKAMEIVKQCGFRYIFTYEKRKPKGIKI